MGVQLFMEIAHGYNDDDREPSKDTTDMQDAAAADDEMSIIELQSKGSLCPYVYTDAGGGLMKNGVYTVKRALRLS